MTCYAFSIHACVKLLQNSSDIIISIVIDIAWPLKVYIRLKDEAVLGNLCELGRFHHSDTKGIGIGEAKRADEH